MPSETKQKTDDLDRDDDGSGAAAAQDAKKRKRDEDREEREERDEKRTAVTAAKASKPGFFTVYKPGQGFWTRVGTYVGAGLIGFLIAVHIYIYLPTMLPQRGVLGMGNKTFALAIAAAFLAIFAAFLWRLTNKPDTVDFLIATDSEMKKVNWTSRKELIGSTKVVILFMVFIAVFLFICDMLFGVLFFSTGVLKVNPLRMFGF